MMDDLNFGAHMASLCTLLELDAEYVSGFTAGFDGTEVCGETKELTAIGLVDGMVVRKAVDLKYTVVNDDDLAESEDGEDSEEE